MNRNYLLNLSEVKQITVKKIKYFLNYKQVPITQFI